MPAATSALRPPDELKAVGGDKPIQSEIAIRGTLWYCNNGLHTIETERLILRPIREDDYGAILATFDDVVARTHYIQANEIPHIATQTVKPLPWYARDFEKWAIVHQESSEVIGIRTISPLSGGPLAGATTGGWIAENWRHQGYGSEELSAVVALTREHLGICHLIAVMEETNRPSVTLYRNAGFDQSFRGFLSFIEALWKHKRTSRRIRRSST
jgi:RimJ/RimL family protein N-acetyltransferase